MAGISLPKVHLARLPFDPASAFDLAQLLGIIGALNPHERHKQR
jgi:hypothetical protein